MKQVTHAHNSRTGQPIAPCEALNEFRITENGRWFEVHQRLTNGSWLLVGGYGTRKEAENHCCA